MFEDLIPAFDAAQRAVLENGKHLVCVAPPAGWSVRHVLGATGAVTGPGLARVIFTAESGTAVDIAASLGTAGDTVHACTGLARTERLLRGDALQTLVVTLADAVELIGRSALHLHAVPAIVVLAPETIAADPGGGRELDQMLTEAPDAQRLIVTADPQAIKPFIERHARRAPVADLAGTAHDATPAPERKTGKLRYAVSDAAVDPAVRAALDVLDPTGVGIWDPCGRVGPQTMNYPGVTRIEDVAESTDWVFAVEPPTRPILDALRARGRDTLIVIRPAQHSYLTRLGVPLTPLRLLGEADRARTQAFALRRALRDRLDGSDLTRELLAIEPLLEEFDPALIAAAALRGVAPVATTPDPAIKTWTRLHVGAGRRDQIRPADLLGLLLNQVGLRKEDVGKIEIQDRFSLVEVRPEDVDRCAREMTGQMIRGKRITARRDRK